jgi:hypothetical protein
MTTMAQTAGRQAGRLAANSIIAQCLGRFLRATDPPEQSDDSLLCDARGWETKLRYSLLRYQLTTKVSRIAAADPAVDPLL